jgi:hypothetical protein
MAVHPTSILPGYGVYAHHVDARNRLDAGQYGGTIEAVSTCLSGSVGYRILWDVRPLRQRRGGRAV